MRRIRRSALGATTLALAVAMALAACSSGEGGAQTVAALKSGAIQVALLFSTDPVIMDNGWVALEDDKHLQNAELITPVVRTAALNDEITTLLNGISAKLTTDNIVPLISQVAGQKQDPAVVAKSFLTQQGLLPASGNGAGKSLTVGVSAAFAENQIEIGRASCRERV